RRGRARGRGPLRPPSRRARMPGWRCRRLRSRPSGHRPSFGTLAARPRAREAGRADADRIDRGTLSAGARFAGAIAAVVAVLLLAAATARPAVRTSGVAQLRPEAQAYFLMTSRDRCSP